MISLQHIEVRFGEQIVLDDVSWNINSKSRVALLGPNGAGKTTLLKIIARLAQPDAGSVNMPTSQTAGYLPQDLAEIGQGSVMEYLKERSGIAKIEKEMSETEAAISFLAQGSLQELKALTTRHDSLQKKLTYMDGYAFEAEAKKILVGLGFKQQDATRHCSEFSGGQKMRLFLAALLLLRPDALLLDEPTNHLDTESMEWLENYLRDFPGTLIFVSHDRRFLERTAKEIADLSNKKITQYPYSYAKYIAAKEERELQLEKEREMRKEEIAHISRFVERFRYKASKAAQVQSRVKILSKLELASSHDVQKYNRKVNIKFPEAPRCALEVMGAQNIAKSYGDNLIFSDISLSVKRGERAALVGVNGAGKSTLLRLLNQSEVPSAGAVSLGSGVKKGYFSQESAENLTYSRTIWEEVCSSGSKLNEQERKNLLGAFLFSGEDINKPAGVLSGGEKSRLALLKLLLSDTNFLILDEPTNHLDAATKELFQRALMNYGGAVLLVSHDRYFLDALADRTLEIRDGRIYEYLGNYSYFINRREEILSQGQDTISKIDIKEVRSEKNTKRKEAEERNRLFRLRKPLDEKIKKAEGAIDKLESRKCATEAALCDPKILSASGKVQDLMRELNEIKEALAGEYAQWEQASEELENIGVM